MRRTGTGGEERENMTLLVRFYFLEGGIGYGDTGYGIRECLTFGEDCGFADLEG